MSSFKRDKKEEEDGNARKKVNALPIATTKLMNEKEERGRKREKNHQFATTSNENLFAMCHYWQSVS